MNVERLQHLITILEDVKTAQKPFGMGAWIDEYKDGLPVHGGQRTGREMCGTACCALGYAALDPKCREDGLKMFAIINKSDGSDEPEDIEEEILDISSFNRILLTHKENFIAARPTFKHRDNFGAGGEYYDISYEAAEFLFSPDEYEESSVITPDDVINHINFLLAHDGKTPAELEETEA